MKEIIRPIFNYDGYFISNLKKDYLLVILNMKYNIIWYSLFPLKYLEREGIKDIGTNFFNQGRTDEIRNRYVHLDDHMLDR